MQEPKPKPAPQPVPQLSRAPARPALSVTEAAQLPKAAAAAATDSASGKGSSDKNSGRTAKPAAPQGAPESEPLPGGRQAPGRSVQQAAEISQPATSAVKDEGVSTAAPQPVAESRPLPQLTQAPVRPSPKAIQTSDAASPTGASKAAGSDKQAVTLADSAATDEAPLPQTSSPEGNQEWQPATGAPKVPANGQESVAAERDLAEQVGTTPAVPTVAPEVLPTPQRPNKPKTPAMPTEAGPRSATWQGAEAVSSTAETSSALVAEKSEAQEPSATATPEASQASGATQADSGAVGGSKGASKTSDPAALPLEIGASVDEQPLPPMALPKPALPAAQPDQTGRVSTPLTSDTWDKLPASTYPCVPCFLQG